MIVSASRMSDSGLCNKTRFSPFTHQDMAESTFPSAEISHQPFCTPTALEYFILIPVYLCLAPLTPQIHLCFVLIALQLKTPPSRLVLGMEENKRSERRCGQGLSLWSCLNLFWLLFIIHGLAMAVVSQETLSSESRRKAIYLVK